MWEIGKKERARAALVAFGFIDVIIRKEDDDYDDDDYQEERWVHKYFSSCCYIKSHATK